MKKQIKLFTNPDYKKLEKETNKWMKETDGIVVTNIKMPQKHWTMVIYEE